VLLLAAGLFLTGCARREAADADAARGGEPGGVPRPAATAASEPEADRTEAVTANQLVMLLTVFVLALFVGVELIAKVPPTLHTPLMSGSNAISGITVIGAVLSAGNGRSTAAALLGMLAVALATVNVVGGYLVTHRMLQMFRGKR
jgi:NAD(P) transhydrogenase subunit alpha